MSPKLEQITFVDIRMEYHTNYLFNNAEVTQAVYIQLSEFESYCERIVLNPIFIHLQQIPIIHSSKKLC